MRRLAPANVCYFGRLRSEVAGPAPPHACYQILDKSRRNVLVPMFEQRRKDLVQSFCDVGRQRSMYLARPGATRQNSCEQNTLTRHIFPHLCTHNSVAHDIGSICLSASRHACFMRSGCFDSLRLSTLHSSPSLSSSFSFS